MRRLAIHVVVAVFFFAAGWLGAHARQNYGVFRLTIEAPYGETAVACEGCEFFSWTADGHRDRNQSRFNYTCNEGPCRKVVGAVAVTVEPKVMAGLIGPAAGRSR
jgi:hypothetical protein